MLSEKRAKIVIRSGPRCSSETSQEAWIRMLMRCVQTRVDEAAAITPEPGLNYYPLTLRHYSQLKSHRTHKHIGHKRYTGCCKYNILYMTGVGSRHNPYAISVPLF
eukprot:3899905-Pleurochrysis_carterae.AAC.1